MKKTILAITMLAALAGTLSAQKIPENRDLYVGVWKFAEQNNYQDISKYSREIERFLKNEIMNDLKVNLSTGNVSYEKSFDFENGNSFDLDADEYRILTPQLDKALMGKTLHIFDWTIKNAGGNISVKLNNAITAIVDKNGNWTDKSVFAKSKIMNTKQIEKMATNDVAKYIDVSDDEYKQNKDSVVSNFDFLSSIIPNMTELATEVFVEENNVYDIPTKISFTVTNVEKNPIETGDFPNSKYKYMISGRNGNNYVTGFSNGNDFIKAKKESVVSFDAKIKSIKYNGIARKVMTYFVIE